MTTLYDQVGGTPFFEALVEHFYAGVAADPVLRPMYRDEDLAEAKAHLTGFLVQYWGGPTTYSEQRGHPRLRMRHAPFVIGEAERDSWLRHMTDAVLASDAGPDEQVELLRYFQMAADAMINRS